jgi:hypothetical protein
MLEPLPYRQPDRLVSVWETNRGGTTRNGINIAELHGVARAIADARASKHGRSAHCRHGPERTSRRDLRLHMSFDAFRALGVQPSLGRAYTAEEDLADVARLSSCSATSSGRRGWVDAPTCSR